MSDIFKVLQRTAGGLSGLGEFAPAIVGSVDEGAIIESGSNSNGNWARLADGTQWCYKNISLIGYEILSGFKTYGLVYYPAVFINTPTISIVYTGNTPQSVRATCTDPVEAGVSVQLYNTSTASVVQTFGGIALLAIGRWK